MAVNFYHTRAWRIARRNALDAAEWTCTNPACGRSLIGIGREAHVHHRMPRKVYPAVELEPLNLQPLCRACHTALEHARPMAAIDGTPSDPEHPWNAQSKPGGLCSK